MFLAAQMLGEEVEELSEEVQDAVGEMTNRISGDARRLLGEKGVQLPGRYSHDHCRH